MRMRKPSPSCPAGFRRYDIMLGNADTEKKRREVSPPPPIDRIAAIAVSLLGAAWLMQLFHDLVEREAGGFLPRWERLECLKEFAHVSLRWNEQEGAVEQPVVIGVRRDYARSYGSRRRLKISGMRSGANGSIQARNVASAFCSRKIIFQSL